MKKIMMTKFGFDRWPEEDFSDDGNRFTCYKVGKRVRVSKLVSDGWVYIDGTIHSYDLPYDVYGNLPHYKAIGKLNGIKASILTEDMLTQLYFDCMEFEKEYDAAKAAMVYPTLSEIKVQCMRVQAKRQEELAEINRHFTIAVAAKITKWEWANVREYLLALANSVNNYDPEKYPQTILNTAKSINFCKPDCSELQDSFYYKWIMERINK